MPPSSTTMALLPRRNSTVLYKLELAAYICNVGGVGGVRMRMMGTFQNVFCTINIYANITIPMYDCIATKICGGAICD
jgi:hypothetical protein